MGDRDDWDTTKENIQPLKQGRAITATTFADVVESSHSKELKAKRAELVQAIATYQGEDPLANWITLINWVEASYPNGGSQSGLSQLVKECCSKFARDGQESKKYLNDERFVGVFLKLAAYSDTLKAFEYMHQHEIGTRCPTFYISWAEELESMRNSTEAERVLDLGLVACAENSSGIIKLQNAKNTVLDRDARCLIESGILAGVEEEPEERSMLGGLRPAGKEKKQAPVSRIGPNKISSKPIVKPQDMGENARTSSATVRILETEDSKLGRELDVSNISAEFPFLLTEADRENLIVEKLKIRKKARPGLTSQSSTPLGFQILADPELVQAESKKKNERQGLDRRVLASRPAIEKPIILPNQTGSNVPDWSVTGYHDPSPVCPVLLTQLEPEPLGQLADGPLSTQVFQWAYKTYPSGFREVSFEEGLAKRFRKKCAAEAAALFKKQEETIEDLLCQTHVKLAAAEADRIAAETMRDELKAQSMHLEEERKAFDTEREQLENDREAAERVQRLAEEELILCDKFFRGVTDSLGVLADDISNPEISLFDVVQNFSHDVRGKLEDFNAVEGNLAPGHMVLLQVTEQLLTALEARRLGDAAPPQTEPRKEEHASDHTLPTAQVQEPFLSQSTAYSWQSSQPLTTNLPAGHVTDPDIKALWNQTTMNTTSFREMGDDKTEADSSDEDDPDVVEEPPRDKVMLPADVEPVRQVIGMRKSAKVLLHTSSVADTENVRSPLMSDDRLDRMSAFKPVLPRSAVRIFADSDDQRMDAVPANIPVLPADTSARPVEMEFRIFQDQSIMPNSRLNSSVVLEASVRERETSQRVLFDQSRSGAFEVHPNDDGLSQSLLDLYQGSLTSGDAVDPSTMPVTEVGRGSVHVIQDSPAVAEKSNAGTDAAAQWNAQGRSSDLILLASQAAPTAHHLSFAAIRASLTNQVGSPESDRLLRTPPIRNSTKWRETTSPIFSPSARVQNSLEDVGDQSFASPLQEMVNFPDNSAALVNGVENLNLNAADNENQEMQLVNFGDDEDEKPDYGRKSFAVADMADEFNFTRKSMAFADQTFLPGTEREFFNAIDVRKRMASTPKVTNQPTIFEDGDQENIPRPNTVPRQFRQSYGPALTGCLSAITEESRESKTSSSGNSGCTTHLRTGKKSATNCDPVEEQEASEQQAAEPYSEELKSNFKTQLQDRFAGDTAVVQIDQPVVAKFVPGKTIIQMNLKKYMVESQLGQGFFATVYSIRSRSDASDAWALKVQVKDGWWDYYIQSEAIRRLQARPDCDGFLQYIIGVEQFQRLQNGGSYCILPLYEQGTIVDLVNAFPKNKGAVPEILAMKVTIDILRAVEGLHSVNIIHGDIKADNFLLRSLKDLHATQSGQEYLASPSVVLADFGCGIDLDLFPSTVAFSSLRPGKLTAGLEILKAKPWTFQIDFLGILDTIHVLLFGDYMKVYQEAGVWKIMQSRKRGWSPVWAQTFHTLLNVPSCEELPRLADVRADFEQAVNGLLTELNFEKFARNLRVKVFMNRKSCFVGK